MITGIFLNEQQKNSLFGLNIAEGVSHNLAMPLATYQIYLLQQVAIGCKTAITVRSNKLN